MQEKFLDLQVDHQKDMGLSTTSQADTSYDEEWPGACVSHATLYTFACKWDIEPLRCHALEKLCWVFASFDLRDDSFGDTITLAQSMYENTQRCAAICYCVELEFRSLSPSPDSLE